MRNEWGRTGGKETKAGFLICEEYSVIIAVQRDQSGAGDGSQKERGQQHSLTQEVFGVSWVALRLGLYSHLGPYFCMK